MRGNVDIWFYNEGHTWKALAHASGAHRVRLEAWRGEMLACLAHTEAVIDFGEEEELAGGVLAGVRPRVAALLTSLERHLATGAACS